jgi:hypothetical protein
VSDGRIFVFINFTIIHSFKGRNSHGRTDIFSLEIKTYFSYYYTETVSKQELSNIMSAVPCGIYFLENAVMIQNNLYQHFPKCFTNSFPTGTSCNTMCDPSWNEEIGTIYRPN